jgi:hypothetical protein
MADDLNFQQLSTVQSNLQLTPKRIASATTVAPTTFLTLLSGTVDVNTLTPPVTGCHALVVVWTDASPGDVLTTGNILVGTTTIAQNSIALFIYDPVQAKYYVAKLT